VVSPTALLSDFSRATDFGHAESGITDFISRILWQELGEGTPDARTKSYLDTIVDGDFGSVLVTGSPPLNATRELVAGYEGASQSYLPGSDSCTGRKWLTFANGLDSR